MARIKTENGNNWICPNIIWILQYTRGIFHLLVSFMAKVDLVSRKIKLMGLS